MQSISQFLSYMNDIDFDYVVLRNWENLPHDVSLGAHSDLDLLVYDIDHWIEVFPHATRVYPHPRVQFRQDIGDSYIQIDVRYIGDGYYPEKFEREILETKEWHPKGFWTPNPLHFRLGLAYHAVHHKGVNTYKGQLGDTSTGELLRALKKSKIGWSQPLDPSVGVYDSYWKGGTSIVSKDGDTVIKKQESYEGYDLTGNEARILKKCKGIHFPELVSSANGEVVVEHCGNELTQKNLPKNWRGQFIEILDDLRRNCVVHRDIRPQNIMVKDGVIKLIDFGWARFKDDPPDNPPDCLGFPYKSSEGFDDNFSLRKIAKEILAQCESLV